MTKTFCDCCHIEIIEESSIYLLPGISVDACGLPNLSGQVRTGEVCRKCYGELAVAIRNKMAEIRKQTS